MLPNTETVGDDLQLTALGLTDDDNDDYYYYGHLLNLEIDLVLEMFTDTG